MLRSGTSADDTTNTAWSPTTSTSNSVGFSAKDSANASQTAHAQVEGDLTSVFTWVPATTGELPPPQISVKEVAKTFVTARVITQWGVFAGGDGTTRAVDNGWDDPVLYPEAGGYTERSGIHLVTLLVQFDSSDNKWKAQLTRHLSAWIHQSGSSYDNDIQAHLTYSVALDTRSVHISSPTIETSYYKHYQFGLPVQEPRVRQPDGSISVDSVANWDWAENCWVGQAQIVSNEVGFVQNKDNLWPNRKWELSEGSGTPFFMSALAMSAQEPVLNPPGSGLFSLNLGGTDPDIHRGSAVIGNTESTLRVTVTDKGNDGAIATNTYRIYWHKPVEQITEVDTHLNVEYTKFKELVTDLPPTGREPEGSPQPPFNVTIEPPPIGFEIGQPIRDPIVYSELAYLGTAGWQGAVGAGFLGSVYSLTSDEFEPVQLPLSNIYGVDSLWANAKEATLNHPGQPPATCRIRRPAEIGCRTYVYYFS